MVGEILKDPGLNSLGFKLFSNTNDATLGKLVSAFFNLFFYIFVFLTFFWLVWGIFQYIAAGGEKQKLAEARSRITWAIVGLLIISVALLVAQFAAEILKPKFGTPITLIPTAYAVEKVDLEKEFAFGDIGSLGEGVGRLVVPTFSIAAIVVTIYFLIGAFKYLTAGGDKEATAAAQGMITHSIVGFILLVLLFLIMQYLTGAFGIPDIVGT